MPLQALPIGFALSSNPRKTLTHVRADADDMDGKLVADSFLRWKGLERPVIVVADVSPDLSEFATRMHIALTRALTAARVVGAPSAKGWPGL